jgi:ATPase subunit of ABC transporter with duplicated ATPase domains
MNAMLHVTGARVSTPTGRTLFDGLTLQLGREHVAVVGRNGVGKSTLLAVLAGDRDPDAGAVRFGAGRPLLVPQAVARGVARSHGEARRAALADALRSRARVLLLDEPTEDLDDASVAWLRAELRAWRGACVVVTHDRRVLADFEHFFVLREAGCYAFTGTLAALDDALDRDARQEQERYARSLQRLAGREEHTLHIARRKARKKRRGRASELDRATPRVRLNTKRERAQASHGRCAEEREARLAALRAWTRATRRALEVRLPLTAIVPEPPPVVAGAPPPLDARALSVVAGERELFADVHLRVVRERVAVVGPNGAGKSTLLATLLGERPPTRGSARCERARIGTVRQGGDDWKLDASLVDLLGDAAASIAAAHRFPLPLAARPLASLSPGERARAALIALMHRAPAPEVLVLDEPTFSLDHVARRGLAEALAAWRGGLVVATHDRALVAEIGVDRVIELGGSCA